MTVGREEDQQHMSKLIDNWNREMTERQMFILFLIK